MGVLVFVPALLPLPPGLESSSSRTTHSEASRGHRGVGYTRAARPIKQLLKPEEGIDRTLMRGEFKQGGIIRQPTQRGASLVNHAADSLVR